MNIFFPKSCSFGQTSHLPVFRSYEALGLVASLTPTASGGMEKRHHIKEPLTSTSTLEPSPSEKGVAGQTQTAVPKGYGRIIRDENGNVVDIEMADDETDSQETVEHKLVEDIPDPARQEDLAGWVALGTDVSRKAETTGTVVVQSKSFYLIKMLNVIDVDENSSRPPVGIVQNSKNYKHRTSQSHGSHLLERPRFLGNLSQSTAKT